jgi:hypothetical protein
VADAQSGAAAKRVLYNEGARRDRPMGGMLLKNTSPLTLEDGALTVIDGDDYAGEALMERLKPSEQRLISFALDLGTLSEVKDQSTPVHKAILPRLGFTRRLLP